MITARYTRPCRPLQLAYGFGGVKAEFTLMTRGESGGDDAPASSRAPAPELSARQTPAPVHFTQTNTASDARQMPPPRSRSIRPLTGTSTRGTESNTASQRPPPSINFDSLFVPADDDRQWDVPNEDEDEEPQDVLGWDATADQVCTRESSPCNLPLIGTSRKPSTRASGPVSGTMNPACNNSLRPGERRKWVFPQHNACPR